LPLRCLLAAAKLAPEDPTLHGQIIRFKKTIDTGDEPLSAEITLVIDSELYPALLPSKDTDLVIFNQEYLARHKDSPPGLFGGLRAKHFLNSTSSPEVEATVLEKIKELLDTYTLQDAYDGLALLRDVKGDEKTIEEFILVAKGRWGCANGLV